MEITFEYLLIGKESTRGTAVAPTHYVPILGTLMPTSSRYRPVESTGLLAEFMRSKKTREWGEWSGDGPLDVYLFPLLASAIVKGGVSTPQVNPATGVYQWQLNPNMTSDDLDSLTVYFGDPNVQVFRGAFGMIDEITISSDASSTDGSTMSISGVTQTPENLIGNTTTTGTITNVTAASPPVVTSNSHGLSDGDVILIEDVVGDMGTNTLNDNTFTIANSTANTFELSGADTTGETYTSGGTWTLQGTGAPTTPTRLTAPLITGLEMEVWLDVDQAIGTTAVQGRVVSATHTIPLNAGYKYVAAGPAAAKTYSRIGRGKRSIVTTVVMEIPDMDEYYKYRDDDIVKLRVRHNGSEIGSTGYYHYIQVDTYGRMDFDSWGELEGTNRTVTFSVTSEYDATAGYDFGIEVQNDRNTL